MTFLINALYVWCVGVVFLGACFGMEWILMRCTREKRDAR